MTAADGATGGHRSKMNGWPDASKRIDKNGLIRS